MRGMKATVIVEDGSEFSCPLKILNIEPDIPPKIVRSKNDLARLNFKTGDQVSFLGSDGRRLFGAISKINPKYASVSCSDSTWKVAYVNLTAEDEADTRETPATTLDRIQAEAHSLLTQHGLDQWRFTFDHAKRRGGLCRYDQKVISMSEQYCLAISWSEARDTILHEIAHALVGAKHGHDELWKQKALEIGCSAEVSHDVKFSGAMWLATCRRCKWQVPRHRRRRDVVCAKCENPVVFIRNQ